MAKKKLARFTEIATFKHVVQPDLKNLLKGEFELKGKWNENFFKNDNPIVLELGCGKGEYTVGLARNFPDKNYIGIDIKGARMWHGAKTALNENLKNVGFLRTKVDFLSTLFAENEISEIWITFPDPQSLKPRKRLSGAQFLNTYRPLLVPNGIINLKTDSDNLYQYTLKVLEKNNLSIHFQSNDLYRDVDDAPEWQIKTFYEQIFLKDGKNINYIRFTIDGYQKIEDLPLEEAKYEKFRVKVNPQ